jgi:hypothetical protein
MAVRKTATKAPVRRKTATTTPVRKTVRRRSMGSAATRRKSALKATVEGAAGGAIADLLGSALANTGVVPASLRPFIPLLGAAATDYFFKRPLLAAGMAGAGAGRALAAVGLGDGGQGFTVESMAPSMALEASPMALQDYGYAGLAESPYDSQYGNYLDF